MQILRWLFLIILWSTLLKPLYDFPDFLLQINIAVVHQVLSGIFVLVGFIYIFLRLRIARDYGLNFLLISSFIIGVISCNFNEIIFSVFISHCYYLIMPIVCFNIGYFLWNQYGHALIHEIRRVASLCLVLLVILTFCYYILHFIIEKWDYFGYTSGLISAYVLTKRFQVSRVNWRYFFLDIFTGKRSSLVLWIFLAIKKNLIISIIIGVLFYFSLSLIIDLLPSRYGAVFNFKFGDPVLMSLATGGRSNEWFSIIDYLNSSPNGWLFGAGFGQAYDLYDPINDFWELRHYSHMTPLTYSYLVGAPMALLIFLYLIIKNIMLEKVAATGMESFFIIYLVLSPLGGSLLVEPLPWLLFGICCAAYRKRNEVRCSAKVSFDYSE